MIEKTTLKNLPASILARLKNHAQATEQPFDYTLIRYALERLMYRFEQSPFSDRFVVKGAMLFLIWADEPYRPTRDLDLMIRQAVTQAELAEVFRAICTIPISEDGLRFDVDQIIIEPIRAEEAYPGLQVKLMAFIGTTRIPVRVDIGFGDAITPPPSLAAFPAILNYPQPHLLCYPRETVVAEKLDAVVQLGMANSRMKDYYDLFILSRIAAFDGPVLTAALRNTFDRRKRILPDDTPIGLSDTFGADPSKNAQWKGFLRRSRITLTDVELLTTLSTLRLFLLPPYEAVKAGQAFTHRWPENGPWTS